MEKKLFTEPTIETILVDEIDILTTSGEGPEMNSNGLMGDLETPEDFFVETGE